MGLSVGGIYVRTSDHQAVVAAIRKHWLAVGARPLDAAEDPLALQPLGVEKTGKLGYAVWPPAPDGEGTEWVAVYDSERYHGSDELARFLAAELDTTVAIYAFTSSVDMASLATYHGVTRRPRWHADSDDWGEIETAIGALPYPFVYYNQLGSQDAEALGNPAIFGFEGLPYREAGYRGPSQEERRGMAMLDEVAAAVAAGDVKRVRATYDAEEHHRYQILSAVTDGVARGFSNEELGSPEALARARAVVLEMSEELLADPGAYWRVSAVAEAAFLAGDRALFERAARALGRHVARLEGLARQLAEARQYEQAVEVWRAVVAHEGAPLTAWNNLAHALCFVSELPSDAADLLARADAHGMANSYIFHNTACVWLRLGERERALEAVRGAVRAGYPELAKLRADPDLAPLFDDPRFVAAFDAPADVSLDELVVTKLFKGETYVVQRPALVFDFFLEPLGTHVVGPAIAALAEAYLAEIPPDALTSVRRNGPWKKLTRGAQTKDLNKLRTADRSQFIDLHYRGDTDSSGGAPTEYGLHVEVWGESEDFGEHTKVPTVTLWFPAALAGGDVDAIAARFARYAAMMPVEAGGAGLRVMLRKSDYVETWWESHLLAAGLSRFLGSERHPWREWKAGCAAGAMWLTFLSKKLAGKLGGARALRDQVAPAIVEEAGGGVVLRASLRPALGVGPNPADLGLLPRVARALEPLMVTNEKAREDPAIHYRRLFDVPDGPYANGPAVVPDPALRATRAERAEPSAQSKPEQKPKAVTKAKAATKAKGKAATKPKAAAKAKAKTTTKPKAKATAKPKSKPKKRSPRK
ncbi:MAG: DUF3396 domain-containing protein [Kofleriaceae bacterium]